VGEVETAGEVGVVADGLAGSLVVVDAG